MKFNKTLTVLLVAATLAGCADAQNNPKQTVGTLAGAGLGALLGSQIGGGRGQLAAVAIGALAGGYFGGQIGHSLDENDRLHAQRATQQALETAPSGTTVAWSNPDSGHRGTVTPQPAFQRSGEVCREYTQQVVIGGKTEQAVGTACRQSDGSWRVVN